MGLGFFFLGIYFMKVGFEVYREQIDLAAYAIPGFPGLVVFTFIVPCIEYATLAQGRFSLSRKKVEAFSRIKVANRDMVEAIKSLGGLRKNVN